jgi:ABC-type antimicrobial peptide transport system permease subunit
VATIAELMDRNTARQRFNTVLLVIFGFSSLLLMGAGVYSVIAEAVVAKTREIGIRLALGADRTLLVRRFVTRTIGFVLAGEAAGVVGSVFIGHTLSAFLYGIRPGDPAVFTAVLAAVLLIAGVAASIPAWMAAGQNPTVLLR